MRTYVLGLMLALGTAPVALAGAGEGKPTTQEQSVVDYASKTHGAVQVKGASPNPGDWFDVLQNGKRVFNDNPPLLDGTMELAPGVYVVDVNHTQRKVTIEAGKKTILLTGDLMVASKRKRTWWVPKQGKENRVVSNPPVVNTRVALFPGTYDVYINAGPAPIQLESLGRAQVKAGEQTVVQD